MTKLNRTSSVQRNPSPLTSRISGDVVLFDSDRGAYFGMNGIGSKIWDLIEEPKTLDQLIKELQTSFEVSETRCETEVVSFLNKLQENKLIEVLSM